MKNIYQYILKERIVLSIILVFFLISCDVEDSDTISPTWNVPIEGIWVAEIPRNGYQPEFEILLVVENIDNGYFITETNLNGFLNPQIQVNSRGEFAFRFYEFNQKTILRGQFSRNGNEMRGSFEIEDNVFGVRKGFFIAYKE
ncbi:MAG: hypothetical protein OHK0038_15280 [Flammeovirgaceae bacterium]